MSSVFEAGVRATISGRFITPKKVRVMSRCSSPQRGIGPQHTMTLTRQGSYKAPKTFPQPDLKPVAAPPPAPTFAPLTAAEAQDQVIAWKNMLYPPSLSVGTQTDLSALCTVTDADHATCSMSWVRTTPSGVPPGMGLPAVITQQCTWSGLQVSRRSTAWQPVYDVQATALEMCL